MKSANMNTTMYVAREMLTFGNLSQCVWGMQLFPLDEDVMWAALLLAGLILPVIMLHIAECFAIQQCVHFSNEIL